MSSIAEFRRRTVSEFVATYLQGILRSVKCRIVIESDELDRELVVASITKGVAKEQEMFYHIEGNKIIIDNTGRKTL